MKTIISLTLLITLALPVDALAGGKGGSGGFSGGRSSGGFSGGGGRSYSGGGKSSFTPSIKPSVSPSVKPSVSPSVKPSNSGKSYSGSTTPSKGVSSTKTPTVSPSQKPTAVSVDKAALRDFKTVESRTAYKTSLSKGEAPKSEYKSPSGATVKIDPKDKRVESIRNVPHESWANRESRTTVIYSHYYNHAPIFPATVVYHDPIGYNPWFWFWLMDRSTEQRALWMYNHHDGIDPARYQYLVGKDAQLEARIRQLEREKVHRDSSYTPPGIDPDIPYDDSFVDAVVNPHTAPVSHSGDNSGSGFGWVCFGFLILLCLAVVIYGVFFYQY